MTGVDDCANQVKFCVFGDKDIAKARHYINFIANRENGNDPMKPMEVEFRIDMLVSAAKAWDGKER